MILEIPELISELVPGRLDGGPVSVACVRATRPKYLVFGVDSDRPNCVVQFGPPDAMEREHHALLRLHPVLPDLVAAPLALNAWSDGLFVQVQSGLPGSPWFRLRDRVRSAGAWNSLGQRAFAGLNRLHDAVRSVPEWMVIVRPGEELRRQWTACQLHGPPLSGRAGESINRASELLDDLGAGRTFGSTATIASTTSSSRDPVWRLSTLRSSAALQCRGTMRSASPSRSTTCPHEDPGLWQRWSMPCPRPNMPVGLGQASVTCFKALSCITCSGGSTRLPVDQRGHRCELHWPRPSNNSQPVWLPAGPCEWVVDKGFYLGGINCSWQHLWFKLQYTHI